MDTSIASKIKSEIKAFEDKKKALVQDLGQQFSTLFEPLFNEAEKIDSVSWRQYTPYFNDGEECHFGVYADDLEINSISPYDSKDYDKIGLTDEDFTVLGKFTDVIQSIPESFLKDLFGDHVTVTIHRDGTTTTEDYDHD